MRLKKIFKYIFGGLVVFILLAVLAHKLLVLAPPEIEDESALNYVVTGHSDSLVFCDTDWLHKNSGGINELYISGAPFEMGVKNGMLTEELAQEQEKHFFNFIKKLVPSTATLKYLKYFIAFFNKDLDKYIPIDLRKEIYGISLFASDDYDFIGEKYHRILNYHAAHDIGHTIQNMNLVNCTAFSVQNEFTKDSTLLIGRNLDFSAGDSFAKNKLVVFCNPDKGHKFAYITWGGMIGVLSGMNEHGLTITLNSAKSGIPLSAKTPVSLISREVLQYAENIDEAYDIIRHYETFVSESFFVGSAYDNKAVVIEKSLDTTAIYDSNKSKLVLTNHFQSDVLSNSELNIEAVNEGCTMYRLERTHELIDSSDQLDYNGMVEILRDKDGKENKSIGIGNEAAVNQLICHHSVVFNPEKRMMWVSEYPYQENGFITYDLNVIFSDSFNITTDEVDVKSERIKASEFYNAGGVDSIWQDRRKLESIKSKLTNNHSVSLSNQEILSLEQNNPDYFYTHYVLGLYYKSKKEYEKAYQSFNKGLSCEIPRLVDKEQVLTELEVLKSEGIVQQR